MKEFKKPSYWENEIIRLRGRIEKRKKEKKELEKTLKEIEEDIRWTEERIPEIEKLLEKENNQDFSKLKDGFITTPEDEKLVNQLKRKLIEA